VNKRILEAGFTKGGSEEVGCIFEDRSKSGEQVYMSWIVTKMKKKMRWI
jgi:hypothetical protein